MIEKIKSSKIEIGSRIDPPLVSEAASKAKKMQLGPAPSSLRIYKMPMSRSRRKSEAAFLRVSETAFLPSRKPHVLNAHVQVQAWMSSFGGRIRDAELRDAKQG
jgi:hypothetical protein